MVINQFNGVCSCCGVELQPGDGFAFRNPNGKYQAVCQGRICVEKVCPQSEIKSYERHMQKANVRRLLPDGTIDMPYEYATLALVQAMPGSFFDGKTWKVSTATKDRRRVLELAKKINLEVAPELLTIEIPDRIKKLKEELPNSGLFPWQQEGVLWIAEQESCLLADEQGLGKTATVLVSLDKNYGHIIACPTEVVYNWLIEGLEWRSDLSFSIIENSKKFRIPKPGEVVITSYGIIPTWVAPERGKRKNLQITNQQKEDLSNCVVVFDEMHTLANPKTKRSWHCRHLRKLCHHAIGLTGTPVRNKEIELWHMFNVLGLAETVFGSYPAFIKMMDGKKGRYSIEFGGNIRKDVPERLRRVMLRRLKKDVHNLPSKIFEPIFVNLPEEVKIQLDNAWDLYKRTSQFNSGVLPDFKEMSEVRKKIAISHIPIMLQQIENYEASETPLIVVSCHKDPILELKNRPGWDIIIGGMSQKDKQKIVEKWQSGKLKGIGITLKAASTGITLTYGHHMLRVDQDWVPANNEQFSDRIHRIGQTETCFYRDIISEHPLVRHVYKLNNQKMMLANKTIERLIVVKNNENENESNSLNETKEDFDIRINSVKLNENKKRRNAVLHHLSSWCERIPHNKNKVISTDRAMIIKSAVEKMLSMSQQPSLRRSGKVLSGKFSPSHQQIISLLNLAGMESQEELRLAEAILIQYFEPLHESCPQLFSSEKNS